MCGTQYTPNVATGLLQGILDQQGASLLGCPTFNILDKRHLSHICVVHAFVLVKAIVFIEVSVFLVNADTAKVIAEVLRVFVRGELKLQSI